MIANRFDSPETKGQKSVTVSGIVSSANHITMVDDYSKEPPRTDKNYLKKSQAIGAGGAVGLTNHLDGGIEIYNNAPFLGYLKYQLLGSNEKESEKENFSISTKLGFGYQSKKEFISSLNSTPKASAKLENKIVDFSFIEGYRFSKSALISMAQFITTSKVEGDISYPKSGQTYNFSGNGGQYGVSLGLQFDNEKIIFKIDSALTYVYWNNSVEDKELYHVGVLTGFKF